MMRLSQHRRVLHLNGLKRPRCPKCNAVLELRAQRNTRRLFFGCPNWSSTGKNSCTGAANFEEWADKHALAVYQKSLMAFVNYGAMTAEVSYNVPLVSAPSVLPQSSYDLRRFTRAFNNLIIQEK